MGRKILRGQLLGQSPALDLQLHDLKISIGIIYSLEAINVPSLVTMKQCGQLIDRLNDQKMQINNMPTSFSTEHTQKKNRFKFMAGKSFYSGM